MTRKCLICGAQITQIHMGIDACRACAVFYRRARRSKCKFRCKSSTGRCVQEGRVLECRRCRFDVMHNIFERATLEIIPDPRSNHRSEPECASDLSPPPFASDDPQSPPQNLLQLLQQPIRSATPIRCPDSVASTSSSCTPVLDRIRCGYNVMTRIRKSTELCMRPLELFVHPTAIDDNSFPIIPATYGLTFRTTQILISSLFDFASIAFPEFETLNAAEKWLLISSCYERVHIMESTFRCTKLFPDDGRVFVSYTMTLSYESVDIFLSDCPKNVNSEEARTTLKKNLDSTVSGCKRAMRRTDPTDEEFLVMLALSFWNTDSPSSDERLNKMATTNRRAIMQDLHSYYSSKGVTDYASRIGELFCLLVTNERVTSIITEDTELLRLMDVYQQPRF
ncbi:hypothetical protein PRIPAC_81462 [Pristionchus pacificus]|uniref:Nuclear receptor n=1 Tax=Pristionchus pacificus TaxID=54126 RepID=A0A8R1V7X3_PRIPA|nr:hypothetical protein PRIPAC_81462 [Pristionchus pacificus]